MKILEIIPLEKSIKAEINMPGSKSLTNRALIIASIANGVSILKNVSKSADSEVLVQALKKLGVTIIKNAHEIKIIGNGGNFKSTNCQINVGEAGTAMRFLTSLVALIPGQIKLIGSKRLMERPINELKEALKKIKTGKVLIRGNISSQFISSLMMIASVLKKGLEINITGELVSRSYVDMTIDLLNKFGVKVINNNYKTILIKNQKIIATHYEVEGDASGASYFWALAAITKSQINIKNVSVQSVQGDAKFRQLAKKISQLNKNTTVDMSLMPDSAQTLAVLAAFRQGKTKITGLSTLKVKETDRLVALKNELNRMGIKSEITNSSITIFGGQLKAATIETYGDHRMAMAFAVAGAKISGIKIKNPEVVNKSFPDYFQKLNYLGIKTI